MAIKVLKIEVARDYAEAIVETVREPLVVMNEKLRVITANRAFYKIFHVNKSETEQKLIYKLGNGQWDNPKLRYLLESILPNKTFFQDFELEHEFPVTSMKAYAQLLQKHPLITKDKKASYFYD